MRLRDMVHEDAEGIHLAGSSGGSSTWLTRTRTITARMSLESIPG